MFTNGRLHNKYIQSQPHRPTKMYIKNTKIAKCAANKNILQRRTTVLCPFAMRDIPAMVPPVRQHKSDTPILRQLRPGTVSIHIPSPPIKREREIFTRFYLLLLLLWFAFVCFVRERWCVLWLNTTSCHSCRQLIYNISKRRFVPLCLSRPSLFLYIGCTVHRKTEWAQSRWFPGLLIRFFLRVSTQRDQNGFHST